MAEPIARQVLATGGSSAELARALVDRLASPALQIAFVFADHRLDPLAFAGIQRLLSGPVVGAMAAGVIGPGSVPSDAPAAVGLGLYGDAVRVGVSVAPELSRAALTHGRDAVHHAALSLGTTVDALDPGRHVAITLFDGRSRHEDAFCIGTAASAPKIRFVGGAPAVDLADERPTVLWAKGEVLTDAGIVVVLDCEQPFHAVSSSHLLPTEIRTVVTAANGCVIEELDGRPAAPRLRQLVAGLGDVLDEPRPAHALARYLDGVPYVRSLHRVDGNHLVLTSTVEVGHILRIMRPGDLIRTTRRDLETASDRVGGTMAAFVGFSCGGRHAEAVLHHSDLMAAHATYPMIGVQTLSEQSGMLLVNHTLTGLAIGVSKP